MAYKIDTITKKEVFRTFEDYSASPLISNSSDCTSAINAALADTANIHVPIHVLGKTYLTDGGHLLPSYLKIFGTSAGENYNGGSIIKQRNANNTVNLVQSASWGIPGSIDYKITIQDMTFHGGLYNQTANACSPQTYLTTSATISSSASTINVVDTSNFPDSGSVWVGIAYVAYTGKTSTSFTGCTTNTTSRTYQAGAWVTPFNAGGNGIALQAALSSLTNVCATFCRASNLHIQGNDSHIAYQNSFINLQVGTSNRFGVEIGERASDNTFIGPMIGDHNGMGCALVRPDNIAMVSPHFVGSQSPQDAMVIIAGSDFRCSQPVFDTAPWTTIKFDHVLKGGFQIADVVISDATSVYLNSAGTNNGVFMGAMGSPAFSSLIRGRITGSLTTPSSAPYLSYLYHSGTSMALVGAQNPTTISMANGGNGLLQLDNISCLPDVPTTAQTVNVGGDVITYTGRSKALDRVRYTTSTGSSTLQPSNETLPYNTAWQPSGTLLVGGGTVAGVQQIVTYTGFDGTKFTGVSGITSDIVAGTCISQCFLTGVSGATSGIMRASGTGASFSARVLLQGMRFGMACGSISSALYLPGSGDFYTIDKSITKGNRPIVFRGNVTITSGSNSISTTHGLTTTPTILLATPQSDIGAGIRYYVTADSTNLTVSLVGGAAAANLVFTVQAELGTV